MEDIELNNAARVKTIIAMRVKVMLRGWLPESIVIIYLISIMMHMTWKQIYTTFTIFVFLVYKIKAYAKIEHWGRNYLISNWRGGVETKYRGICSCPIKRHFVYMKEVLVPMMPLI